MHQRTELEDKYFKKNKNSLKRKQNIHRQINKNNVLIVNFNRMMKDFDGLMSDIIDFAGFEATDDLLSDINTLLKHSFA